MIARTDRLVSFARNTLSEQAREPRGWLTLGLGASPMHRPQMLAPSLEFILPRSDEIPMKESGVRERQGRMGEPPSWTPDRTARGAWAGPRRAPLSWPGVWRLVGVLETSKR